MKATHLLLLGLTAAAVAGFVVSRPSGGDAAPAPRTVETAPDDPAMPPGHPPTTEMPPGHPPTTEMPPGHPPAPAPAAAQAEQEPTLSWKVPARWKEVPSPSPMRLATYRLPGSEQAECSVVRAGGTADANIDRWIAQFDASASATAKRSKANLRGLTVSRLEIRGTYLGGGMIGGAQSEPHKGWALLGLVVEGGAQGTAGMSHFFKITGPEAVVAAATADVDALVASLAPK